jgi:spore coat protein I
MNRRVQGAAMREYELEVLEQYHIEKISTRKIRGAFFIDTNEGTMLLKETTLSDRRALLLYTLLCHLEAVQYPDVDTPVFNQEHALVSTSRDGKRYMLKKWYGGRECDVRRENDVLDAAANLARLHRKMRWQNVCGVSEREEIRPPVGRHLKEEFVRYNRELKKVRSFVRSRVNKGKFEYLYLENFERMYQIAMDVTRSLEQSGYESLYRESIEENLLIHGDYNYHNVILTSGKMATVNFERFRLDVQAQDLYYFLRKVMEKHHWNPKLGDAMLDAYSRRRPLNSRELEYIALKLAYPEKFWKVANTYYHSNKAWIPEKNVEKLMLATLQTEEKNKFLEDVFSFHL